MSDSPSLISDVPGAPKPVGPYSAVAIANGFAFLSGQVGIDPAVGTIVTGGIEAQTRQVLANINSVLASLKLKWTNVVKTTIFLTDLKDFQLVNSIYGETLEGHKPPRSTIQVAALPLGAIVEIEMIAAI